MLKWLCFKTHWELADCFVFYTQYITMLIVDLTYSWCRFRYFENKALHKSWAQYCRCCARITLDNRRIATALTPFPLNSLPGSVAMVSACSFMWLPWGLLYHSFPPSLIMILYDDLYACCTLMLKPLAAQGSTPRGLPSAYRHQKRWMAFLQTKTCDAWGFIQNNVSL